MQCFKELKVGQRSHRLALDVYGLTSAFPSHERFGLTAQLRRAALSVPTNIAEGSKREGLQDYARFLNLAEASLAETQYLLLVTRDLAYAPDDDVRKLASEADGVARVLHALRLQVLRRARAVMMRCGR